MTNSKELSSTLLELRKKKGITQVELGREIGVTNKTISKWENGVFLPDITYLVAIADFYEISVDELLRGTVYDIEHKKSNNVIESYVKRKYITFVPLVILLAEIGEIFVYFDYIVNSIWMIIINSFIMACLIGFYVYYLIIHIKSLKKK